MFGGRRYWWDTTTPQIAISVTNGTKAEHGSLKYTMVSQKNKQFNLYFSLFVWSSWDSGMRGPFCMFIRLLCEFKWRKFCKQMGHDNTTDHHFGHKWYQGRAWEPEIHSGWVCSRADHCVERDLLDSVADRIKLVSIDRLHYTYYMTHKHGSNVITYKNRMEKVSEILDEPSVAPVTSQVICRNYLAIAQSYLFTTVCLDVSETEISDHLLLFQPIIKLDKTAAS